MRYLFLIANSYEMFLPHLNEKNNVSVITPAPSRFTLNLPRSVDTSQQIYVSLCCQTILTYPPRFPR